MTHIIFKFVAEETHIQWCKEKPTRFTTYS